MVDVLVLAEGEPFDGHEVSLNSVPDSIVVLATTPGMHVPASAPLKG